MRAHESVSGDRYADRRKRQRDRRQNNSDNIVDADDVALGGLGRRSYGSQVGENRYKNGIRVEARRPPEEDSGGASFGGGFWGKGGGASGDSDGSANSKKGSGKGARSGGVFLSRMERSAREEAEKRKDRRRRFELFSDVPEEYASLF